MDRIVAFPQQQWLGACATVLRYTYTVHLVAVVFFCQNKCSGGEETS